MWGKWLAEIDFLFVLTNYTTKLAWRCRNVLMHACQTSMHGHIKGLPFVAVPSQTYYITLGPTGQINKNKFINIIPPGMGGGGRGGEKGDLEEKAGGVEVSCRELTSDFYQFSPTWRPAPRPRWGWTRWWMDRGRGRTCTIAKSLITLLRTPGSTLQSDTP